MYVETWVLSLIAWLLVTRTSLGMSRFLKLLLTGWFALVVVACVFNYTQDRDWRNFAQALLWTVISLNTYLAKPIDKKGFWRALREGTFPAFDIVATLGFLVGFWGLYSQANILQMTQPIVERVIVAEGARGEKEVARRLGCICPSGSYVNTLWSGRLYLACDSIHEWDEVTSVYVSSRPDPKGEKIASAVVAFDNQTGEISFIRRGWWRK